MTLPVVGIVVAKATLDVFWMSTECGESKQFENSPFGYQHLIRP